MRHPEERAEFGERGKHYLPVTLAELLPTLLGAPDRRVLPVHRIDRDTTGLVVFARTRAAERSLNLQFREHSIERRYCAIVRGTPTLTRIESHFVRDRGDGRRGSARETGGGQRAVTHIRVLEEFAQFSMVECKLETGRTHQVRIHLGEHGTPLCGETIYDRPIGGSPLADGSGAKRPMLHAAHLGVEHPETREWMEWDCPLPGDMMELLERSRGMKTM
jgi:23S rRNA pseudouridine1911/1915/1917 synthase